MLFQHFNCKFSVKYCYVCQLRLFPQPHSSYHWFKYFKKYYLVKQGKIAIKPFFLNGGLRKNKDETSQKKSVDENNAAE